jgi:glycerol-3-phosphate dehydrogenase
LEDAEQVGAALAQYTRQVEQAGKVSADRARGMVEWHGAKAVEIARAMAHEALRQPLCEHGAHTVAEAVHACAQECAITLADILLRRVPVALGACWSEQCTRQAASRIGRVLEWDRARIAAETEAFEAERAAFLVKPSLERQSAA